MKTPATLEQSLLEASQGPTLDGERRVQWVTAVPSLIHCSAVPRRFGEPDNGPFAPVSVVTMKQTRGNKLPR